MDVYKNKSTRLKTAVPIDTYEYDMNRPNVERPLRKVNGLIELDRCIDRYLNINNNLEMRNICITKRIIHMKVDLIHLHCHIIGAISKRFQVFILLAFRVEILKNRKNINLITTLILSMEKDS